MRSTMRVAHIDIELERHRELVVHQAGRDKDALRITQIQIAVADGVVAQLHVIAVGDHRVFALAHGQRDEVIRVAVKGPGGRFGNGGDHALKIGIGDGDLARNGITNAIGRLRNREFCEPLPRECA